MHVRRAGNKMADYIANVAMDAGRNVVVDNTASEAGHAARLCELLQNDLTYQPSHVTPTTNLLSALTIALNVRDTPPDAPALTAQPTKRHKTAHTTGEST
jgi:hypothetical protein